MEQSLIKSDENRVSFDWNGNGDIWFQIYFSPLKSTILLRSMIVHLLFERFPGIHKRHSNLSCTNGVVHGSISSHLNVQLVGSRSGRTHECLTFTLRRLRQHMGYLTLILEYIWQPSVDSNGGGGLYSFLE